MSYLKWHNMERIYQMAYWEVWADFMTRNDTLTDLFHKVEKGEWYILQQKIKGATEFSSKPQGNESRWRR